MGAQQSAPVVEDVGESTGPAPPKVGIEVHQIIASFRAIVISNNFELVMPAQVLECDLGRPSPKVPAE